MSTRGSLECYPADILPFWRADRITVAGYDVRPVGRDFYGSWVTSRVVGPFEGEPGMRGW